MTDILLRARALVGTRFAVSPLMQAAAVLHPRVPSECGPPQAVRHALHLIFAEGRLPFLAALRHDVRDYAPDFLTPARSAHEASELDDELHQITRTPAAVVARQMIRLVEDCEPPATHRMTSAVRPFLELGEDRLAERAALELEVLWKAVIAPMWPVLRARANDDVDRRARLVLRYGLARALDSLHPAIACHADVLSLPGSRAVSASTDLPIVLFPSPLTRSWLLSMDPWNQRGPYLIYPAASGATAARPAETARHPLTDVIGHTRFTLLVTLSAAHTTSDLARRHHLSASTVSYHLAHLHRAGLVTRVRTGKQVRYRQTALAAELMDQAGRGRRGAPLPPRRGQEGESSAGVISA
ncbi:helix-turn-helix domain-containing protein [Streptomyces fradiae]|uniref:ArsR/SmtB family transcription factor n=2 Tax=Streptomyces TaxID=1883 RepID=UPI002F41A417